MAGSLAGGQPNSLWFMVVRRDLRGGELSLGEAQISALWNMGTRRNEANRMG
jgi:hypothetical protein